MTGLFIAFALLQLFSATRGLAERPQGGHTLCHASGACYSVHLASLSFSEAEEACARYGGGLSTASGTAEVQTIFALLRGVSSETGTSFFWLGLVRKSQQCTNEELPLRGFSWAAAGLKETPANETVETPCWVTEPSKSCTRRKCARLQPAPGETPLQRWGLQERLCNSLCPGYICKYRYKGACPAIRTPGAGSLTYTLPHRVQSTALEFGPLDTVLTLSCPTREARFTCLLTSDGYHWQGTENGLCSCLSGLWSPGQGDCAKPGDCIDAPGAFLCLCVEGFRLAADEKSCLGAESGAFLSNSTSSPAQNSSLELFPSVSSNGSTPGVEETLMSSNSSNYVFILITVAVVMLVILVMASLQSFQICFKICFSKRSEANKDLTPVAAMEGDPEASATFTNSEHSLGPSKAESPQGSQEDLKHEDGNVELQQPLAD